MRAWIMAWVYVAAGLAHAGSFGLSGRIDADTAGTAGVITGVQSGQLATAFSKANTALQPGATNGLLRAEADTLESVAARGGFAGTETIAPLAVDSQKFGFSAGRDAIGDAWGAYGFEAGYGASGGYWGAYGYQSGYGALGDDWSAHGYKAGYGASGSGWIASGYNSGGTSAGNGWAAYGISAGYATVGDAWGAYGYNAGSSCAHTNSHAFGRHAGRSARGNDRLYIDVYATDPEYAANGATNDRIFGESDGTLYLGRGVGAPGGAVGGTLRGPWAIDGYATDAELAAAETRAGTNLQAKVTADIAAALPASDCTANGTGATLMITGAPPPIAWQAVPSGALAVSVAANAPRNRWYAITSIGKPATAWPAGALVATNSSGTSPFVYAIGPYTGTLWQVVGGGR